jgi:mannose-6-phosphate isomerase-like protein (cupin superfamily)
MTIVSRANAEHYTWGESCDGWRLLAREDLSVIEERVPPGRSEVMHFHTRARQLFYVLAGSLRIELTDRAVDVARGESFEVAPGSAHRVYNPFDVDAVFLVISAPTTTGDRTNVAGRS